jgi:hypothetical protein
MREPDSATERDRFEARGALGRQGFDRRTYAAGAALLIVVILVAGVAVMGQSLKPRSGAGSTSGPAEPSSPGRTQASSGVASPAGRTALGLPTLDTGTLPAMQAPAGSYRRVHTQEAPIVATGSWQVAGSRVFSSDAAVAWTDLADPQPGWQEVIQSQGCAQKGATPFAFGANRVIYAVRPCDLDAWRFRVVDLGNTNDHEVPGVITAPYFEVPAPLMAADDTIYAMAYALPLPSGSVRTVVETHAQADDALLWSLAVPSRVWSIAVGGSRVLVSYAPAGSPVGLSQGATTNQIAWADGAHPELQVVGETRGASPSLSPDGSAAAWFDAGFDDCRVLHVESFSGAPVRALDTGIPRSAFRTCEVAMSAQDGRPTAVWYSADPDWGSFLGVMEPDGSARAVIGLPHLSGICLSGRTVVGGLSITTDWIVLDLDAGRLPG